MTTQEFQQKLEELINQAPEECVIFLTSGTHRPGEQKIFYVQGKMSSVLADVSLFACKESNVKAIIDKASEIANNPFIAMMSQKF